MIMKKLIALTLTLFSSSLIASAEVETYEIDPVHSSVKFSIRHFVAKTTGKFNQFEGTILVDREDWSKSSVNATISVTSVDTANEKRDAHLQEDEYFDSAKHPQITFQSTKWEPAPGQENTFKVTGDLTMLGNTKEVVLEAKILGFGPGMNGAYLSGWEVTTQLDRTEWGISGGQPAVGAEVDVMINIEAIRQ
jgi:polyisoprenoid-binding protein YceI